jgi:hypothetical protein
MNIEFFPQFIRFNYPELRGEKNDVLIEMGKAFKEYLQDVFKGKEDKLEPIWNIDPQTIVKNAIFGGFLYNQTHGYHPGLIIHFSDFVDKMKKEIENDIKT